MIARRGLRRRGGSFTFIVLAVSVLILSTATVLVDTIRNTYRQGAETAARVRLREAAFAGVTWARRAHANKDAARAAVLELHKIQVKVSYVVDGQRLKVISVATQPNLGMKVLATLAPRAAGRPLQLDTFTIQPVKPGSAAGTPKKTAPEKTAPEKTAPEKTAPKKTEPKKTAPKKASRDF